MKDIITKMLDIRLVTPNAERDAPFALAWFASEFGKETLSSMGNAEDDIKSSTLKSEKAILNKFLKLEKNNKQLTWMIRNQDTTIGAAWIELVDTAKVKSPSVHIIIGDKNHRGKGIGKAVMSAIIKYAINDLQAAVIYSRHLVINKQAKALLESLGFVNDGNSYIDINHLEWQNIHLIISR